LQNAPANHLTPAVLADRARALADTTGLGIDVYGREEIRARGMGAFIAVAAGSDAEPQLIVLRHSPAQVHGPRLGLVGKAVTFDSGGLSLKTDEGMVDMKYDMSGGAAVLEAVGAIARSQIPLPVLALIGATENMPGGGAVKPGDVVTAGDGLTV
jgi:leucyl aminopeptidase